MLGIVIVSYKTDDATLRFVKEELRDISVPIRIVVVDNGASPEEAAALAGRLDGKAEVRPSENGGFAKGNNKGVRHLLSKGEMEAFLFVNNDIRFVTADSIGKLYSRLMEIPDAGAIGPEVVGTDGRRQSPEPYQSLWDKYVWMPLSTPFLSKDRKAKRFSLNYADQAGEGFHYKLMGSCLMVEAKAFLEAGMFDENTFLYAEEPILGERLAAIGKGCYFFPSVQVVHEHGATISKHHDKKRMREMQFDSMAYYYKTYKGYSGPAIGFARLMSRLVGYLQR